MPAEGRKTNTAKFGNRGADGDKLPACHERTHEQDGNGDRDVDDLQERKEATNFRSKVQGIVRKVAKSHPPPNQNLPLTQPVPDSPGGRFREESDHGLWVNWKQEVVPANRIDWREALSNAQPDEGSEPVDEAGGHLWSYLTTPTGQVTPRHD